MLFVGERRDGDVVEVKEVIPLGCSVPLDMRELPVVSSQVMPLSKRRRAMYIGVLWLVWSVKLRRVVVQPGVPAVCTRLHNMTAWPSLLCGSWTVAWIYSSSRRC